MKFKVGDKVKVRKDLEDGKRYGKDSVTDDMLEYLGKSANVVDINENKGYKLDIDKGYWSWTDEMLEPAQDKLRMCEIIGKEVGEKFNIKDYFSNPCFINENGQIRDSNNLIVQCSILIDIINNPDLIEDILKIEYTDRQKEAFKALKNIFNLNFVARDEMEGLYGYTNKPTRGNHTWLEQDDWGTNELDTIHYDIFSFLKWEDEPFEIPTIEEER